jgi:hypothetical protein
MLLSKTIRKDSSYPYFVSKSKNTLAEEGTLQMKGTAKLYMFEDHMILNIENYNEHTHKPNEHKLVTSSSKLQDIKSIHKNNYNSIHK